LKRFLFKIHPPAVLLFLAILLSWGCQPGVEEKPAGPPLKISLAVSPATYSGLIAIADEKGYFKEAGLDVSISLYASGREALEAMCRGEAQVATVADIAFAAKIFTEPSIRILASIGTNVGNQIVARKDRGIQKPSDLRGKRIGFSSQTTSDYFLYAFLISEGILLKDITAVDIPPDQLLQAILEGDVDAVSAFEIFGSEAKKRMKENAVFWESQNNLSYHWLLAAKESLFRSPEVLKRLLRALLKSEGFALVNSEEAKSVIARKWDFDPEFIRETWHRTRLQVSFNQSIVTSLQNYTEWMINKKGNGGTPPDILDYLHTGVLDEVSPRSVTIFR